MVNDPKRQNLSARLKQRERHYRAMFGSVSEGLLVQGIDGRILFVNDVAETILGLPASQMLGGRLLDLKERCLHEDGSVFAFDDYPPIAAARSGQAVTDVIMGMVRSDRTCWIRVNSTPAFLAGLRARAIITSFLDISDLVETQAQLANREAIFSAIFNQTFQFIGLLRPDGTVIEANKAALEAIRAKLEDVVGRPFWDAPWWNHSVEEQARLKQGIAQAAQGQFVRFETVHPSPDGPIWVDFSLKPVFDEHGVVRWLIPEGRDITDLKNREIELVEAKAMAETANQSKSQFLATMSHELRTPLNAILGYSEIVLEGTFGPVNDNYHGYLSYIHQAGLGLLSVIQEILEISRIETGNLDLELEPLHLDDLAAKVQDLIAHHAHDKRLALEFQIPTPAVPFHADRKRMIQILVNLLINAVKFTDRGGRIGLSAEQSPTDTRLIVWDTGMGIAAEHLSQIWEPFSRVESAYVRNNGGSGLGLTLARHLVELQGGTISVDSQLNQGSRFTLCFPNSRCD